MRAAKREVLMSDTARCDRPRSRAAAGEQHFARYAIFYTPQPGTAFAAFGRSWFGRANDGVTLHAFSQAGLGGASFARLAPASGRYTGLHASIRAPFAPRAGIKSDAIKTRLGKFAGRRKPLPTGPLTLARAGRFLVLRPVEATPGLDWLAAQCVASFEDFTAPPSDTERKEHTNLNLSDHQRLLLESYGDPHVMSEYRFSITLTGPLDSAHLDRVMQALWPVLEEVCASGVTVDALSLFGECPGRVPMRLIGRYPFAG
jgi:Protein of unknown function (DUF1045)